MPSPSSVAAASATLPVPTAAERHMLNRFTFGYSLELLNELRTAGGPRAWFENQLYPGRISDTRGATVATWFPICSMTNRQIAGVSGNPGSQHQTMAYATWMRVRSRRQLREVMTAFWRNLFYVSVAGNKGSNDFLLEADRKVRAAALTSFPNLLRTAVFHPSMMVFLDATNQRRLTSPNQNLAREILELHTVGVGNHTQADILNLSRLLTGFTHSQGSLGYDSRYHITGTVKVLGWSHPNRDPSLSAVRSAINSLLTYLALHPATVNRITTRLAVKFVEDKPSSTLRYKLRSTYNRTRGDIRALLRVIVASPDFAAAAGKKVRTPMEEVVGIHRAVIVGARSPQGDFGSVIYQAPWMAESLGEGMWTWVMPNGYREDNLAWSQPSRLLGSSYLHEAVPMGRFPGANGKAVSYRSKAAYFPPGVTSASYAALVDAMARRLLGVRAGAGSPLLMACSAMTGLSPSTVVTPATLTDEQLKWTLATLFDSPEWMNR